MRAITMSLVMAAMSGCATVTPWEADRLGNALIKAAQPKQKKESGK